MCVDIHANEWGNCGDVRSVGFAVGSWVDRVDSARVNPCYWVNRRSTLLFVVHCHGVKRKKLAIASCEDWGKCGIVLGKNIGIMRESHWGSRKFIDFWRCLYYKEPGTGVGVPVEEKLLWSTTVLLWEYLCALYSIVVCWRRMYWGTLELCSEKGTPPGHRKEDLVTVQVLVSCCSLWSRGAVEKLVLATAWVG